MPQLGSLVETASFLEVPSPAHPRYSSTMVAVFERLFVIGCASWKAMKRRNVGVP